MQYANDIDYLALPSKAKLREVVVAVRADEVGHRDVNHQFANALYLATLEQQAYISGSMQQPHPATEGEEG